MEQKKPLYDQERFSVYVIGRIPTLIGHVKRNLFFSTNDPQRLFYELTNKGISLIVSEITEFEAIQAQWDKQRAKQTQGAQNDRI